MRITKLERKLDEIFALHTLILVDVYEYDGKKFRIPKKRIVSNKWLARVLNKELKDKRVS